MSAGVRGIQAVPKPKLEVVRAQFPAIPPLGLWTPRNQKSANGTAEDYIADSSGNGNHLKAGGSTTRPLVVTEAQNGLRGWSFDGTNDIVEGILSGAVDNAAWGSLKPPQYTLAVVFKNRGTISNVQMITGCDKDAPGNTSIGTAIVSSKFCASTVIGGTGRTTSTATTLVAYQAYTGVIRYDGETIMAELNGYDRVTAAATGMPTYPGLQPFSIGDLPFNRGATPQIPFLGHMYECVFWGHALNDDELATDVERLRSIWKHY